MNVEKKLKNDFTNTFNRMAEVTVSAPGRVNLIGEHTDYNDGFVLPCAIEFSTVVMSAKREDDLVKVFAADFKQNDEFSISSEIKHLEGNHWENYVRAVFHVLLSHGHELGGMELAISGNVPQGAGLSSSAALEVALLEAINVLFSLSLTKKQIALYAQQAENEFVGCACGIMDQLISSCGIEGKALAIDCRSLEWQEVSLPKYFTVMMINSNVKRGLVDSEYNMRREQCEIAAKYFGVSHLRDVSIEQFEQDSSALEPVVAMRAKHVIYENDRTLKSVAAFEQNDIALISQLMAESHESMKTLFEITTPEIDYLVNIVSSVLGSEGGVRMTGGGFGGCIVALVPDHLVDLVKAEVAIKYQDKTGLKETVYTSKSMQGVTSL